MARIIKRKICHKLVPSVRTQTNTNKDKASKQQVRGVGVVRGKFNRTTPFRYRAAGTILHRVPAGLKLLAVILLSTAAYVSVYGLAAAIVLILAAAAAARISPGELLRGSKLLVLLSAGIILLKTFEAGEGVATPEILIGNWYIPDVYLPGISIHGCGEGLMSALRIFVPFAAAALLFAVTSMRELRRSLAALEKRLKKTITQRRKGKMSKQQVRGKSLPDHAYVSLGICLMLGFIPRFFEMWEAANLACTARAHKSGLRRLFLLVPLVTGRMMESAADTALALQARGL